jgi:putative transposase
LSELCGFAEVADFRQAHREWVDDVLKNGLMARDDRWSESLAVGRLDFVEKVKNELGFKAAHREAIEIDGTYALREQREAYGADFAGESEALSSENTRFWDENSEVAAT